MWLQNFVYALGVVDSAMRSLNMYCDNSAAVSFSKNTMSTCHSKHIDIKFYFVKGKVAEGIIDIENTPIANMLANLLTKGLPVWCLKNTRPEWDC